MIRKILLIFTITLLALYVALPKEFSIKFQQFGIVVDQKVTVPQINIQNESFTLNPNWEYALGLDISGGSRLVFEAELDGISDERKNDALESLREVISRRVNLFGVSEPNVQRSSFEGRERVIVELPGVTNPDEAISLIGATAQIVFAETGTDEEPGIVETDLTGANLKRAQVAFDPQTGSPVVQLEFDEEGAEKFGEITSRNVGKLIAVLLDGNIISLATVQTPILDGNAQITFGGADGSQDVLKEAQNLTIQLNAGALPVTVRLVQQSTIGASLGRESIDQSIRAGLVGIFSVALFMILNYGRLGFISVIGLSIFAIITLAIYKVIPVVLTLPGIAGFLLSVGMAVDSNILIFERFKEEKTKRTLENALESAFGRAWDSIRDANIATLITCFILANPLDWSFLNTSGPVRGFAITLALGILVSMFTGIFVTRNLLRLVLIRKARVKK